VLNAGSGSGIPQLPPDNPLLLKEEFKNSLFGLSILKRALKRTRSVCLRAL
jgi:hypothetical protein